VFIIVLITGLLWSLVTIGHASWGSWSCSHASWGSWGPGQRLGAGVEYNAIKQQLCGHDVMVQTSAQAKPMPPIQIMDTPTVTVHSVLQRHHFLGKILLDP